MEFKEIKKTSEKVFDGKLLNVYSDKVILPDGNEGIREYIKHGGGSCVIAEKDGKILMVKQFRYPMGETVLEIPAGKINEGETPLETAFRELEEECGVKADKMEKVFEMYPTPAYTSEITYIFKAQGLTETKTNLDKDEFLASEWIDKKILKEMMDKKQIKDGKTLIALLYVL